MVTVQNALSAARAVDAVALEARAASLLGRSIKNESKQQALRLILRMIDLTTLEGQDTPGKVGALCRKARYPDATLPDVPSVAAVCVYPKMVPVARALLQGSGVRTVSVATGFPSGQTLPEIKLHELEEALRLGAEEVDMVISRGDFLCGRFQAVFDEIVEAKRASGPSHLKVILETGELGSYDAIRRAAMLAMFAGADFIKTSTGKIASAATPAVVLTMLEAIRDFHDLTAQKVGMKVAGGVKTAKAAIGYLVIANETLGSAWLTPELFRFGASTLVNDVLRQIRKQKTGYYQSFDYLSED